MAPELPQEYQRKRRLNSSIFDGAEQVSVNVLAPTPYRTCGILHHLGPNLARLEVPSFIYPRTPVAIELASKYVRAGTVASCVGQPRAYRIRVDLGPHPDRSDRREIRLPQHEPAFLSSDSAGVANRHFRGKTVDWSQSGLGLRCPLSLPLGCSVQVELGWVTLAGVVRHCSETATGDFRIGIAVTTTRRHATRPLVWLTSKHFLRLTLARVKSLLTLLS